MSTPSTDLEECPICVEPLDPKTMVKVLGCQHVFCISCLTKWCLQNPICPLDRQELTYVSICTPNKRNVIVPIKTLFYKPLVASAKTLIQHQINFIITLLQKCQVFYHKVNFIFNSLENIFFGIKPKSYGTNPYPCGPTKNTDLMKEFLGNLPILRNYYMAKLADHCVEIKNNSQVADDELKKMDSLINKTFPNDKTLKSYSQDLRMLINCHTSMNSIHWNFHDIESYFNDLKTTHQPMCSRSYMNTKYLRTTCSQISNLLSSRRIIENYIKFVKSLILKLNGRKKNNVLLRIFDENKNKCIICTNDDSVESLKSLCTCGTKCCETCDKLFDLTHIKCPFKRCRDCNPLTPDVNKIARDLLQSYRSLTKKVLAVILENHHLIRIQLPKLLENREYEFSGLTCTTFVTQYDKLLTFHEALKQKIKFFSNLQETHLSEFKMEMEEKICIYEHILSVLCNVIMDYSVDQMLEISQFETKLLNKTNCRRKTLAREFMGIEQNVDETFDVWNYKFLEISEMMQEITNDKVLIQTLRLICSFKYRSHLRRG